MASAYMHVLTYDYNGNIKTWRTFGGNRSDVKDMVQFYKKSKYNEIVRKHPNMTHREFLTLHTSYNTKN